MICVYIYIYIYIHIYIYIERERDVYVYTYVCIYIYIMNSDPPRSRLMLDAEKHKTIVRVVDIVLLRIASSLVFIPEGFPEGFFVFLVFPKTIVRVVDIVLLRIASSLAASSGLRRFTLVCSLLQYHYYYYYYYYHRPSEGVR